MSAPRAESADSSVRIALVGLGDIGLRAHLPALQRHPAVRVAALVDPAPERRDAARHLAADGESTRVHDALADVLADSDAVVLATPPWVTAQLSAQALAAGCFVLAEKPVAVSSDEALSAFRGLSVEQRGRFQAGYTYRHDPALERLRQWMRRGRLGASLVVRAHIFDEARESSDPEHTGRVLAALEHGSPLLHDGAHLVDWLDYLIDAPLEQIADAWAIKTRPDVPAPNLTGARLVYADGTVVLAEVGWWTARLPAARVEVLGDRGLAVLDGNTFDLRIDGEDGYETFVDPADRITRCFDRQLNRFLALVRGDPVDVPGVSHAVECLKMIERIDRVGRGEGAFT
ncbi:MAG: Gfo/Idh/MocA family protein [Dehalococcoidia bacterium]